MASRPPCIEPKARRKRTFGLETEATFANEVSGQWPPSSAAPFENETSVEDRRDRASLRGEGHSVGKVTPWGRVVQLAPFFVVRDGRNLASCC